MSEQFNEQQKEALRLLKLLHDNDILNHVVLIGSWAEYVYAQAGVLPGFTMTLRTIDIDFLVKNLRRPTEPISLPALAKEEGYTVAHDVLMDTTKFFTPGGLEIEFLIPQKGSGVDKILETNLGVNAQALRHLGAIVDNSITVNFLGMKVQVPCPEIYVLTKMIINSDRRASKQRKDMNSVVKLLPFIDFKKLDALFAASTKKEKVRVHEFLEKYKEDIAFELPLDTKIKLTEFTRKNFPSPGKGPVKEPSIGR